MDVLDLSYVCTNSSKRRRARYTPELSTDHRPGRLIDLEIVSDCDIAIATMVDQAPLTVTLWEFGKRCHCKRGDTQYLPAYSDTGYSDTGYSDTFLASNALESNNPHPC